MHNFTLHGQCFFYFSKEKKWNKLFHLTIVDNYMLKCHVEYFSAEWKIMVVGGLDIKETDVSDVQVIYITNKTITSVSTAPSMPYPIAHATVTVGNTGENMFVLAKTYNDDYNDTVFDVKKQIWKTLPLQRRSDATSFMLHNMLYRVGGSWKYGTKVNYITCIDIRNTKSGWKSCGSAYVPHTERPASCVMGEWAWVSGGYKSGSEQSAAVHRWKPGRQWERMANMKKGRVDHAMASDGRLIYVFGGFETSYIIESLDPRENTWHALSASPDRCLNTGAIYLPWGQIVVTGGGPKGPSDTICVYDISDDIWTISDITLKKAVKYAGSALIL